MEEDEERMNFFSHVDKVISLVLLLFWCDLKRKLVWVSTDEYEAERGTLLLHRHEMTQAKIENIARQRPLRLPV